MRKRGEKYEKSTFSKLKDMFSRKKKINMDDFYSEQAKEEIESESEEEIKSDPISSLESTKETAEKFGLDPHKLQELSDNYELNDAAVRIVAEHISTENKYVHNYDKAYEDFAAFIEKTSIEINASLKGRGRGVSSYVDRDLHIRGLNELADFTEANGLDFKEDSLYVYVITAQLSKLGPYVKWDGIGERYESTYAEMKESGFTPKEYFEERVKAKEASDAEYREGFKNTRGGGNHGWHNTNHEKATNEDYETLGISKDATYSQAKKAYHNKIKEYHPDKYKGDDAVEMSTKINNAWENVEKDLKAKSPKSDTTLRNSM